MHPSNSPRGQQDCGELSSFHRGSPNPQALRLYLDGEFHPSIPSRDAHILQLLERIKDVRMLDVGCGLGSVFCHAMLHYGLPPENLYSLDPDKRNFSADEYPRLHKVVGTVEMLDFPSQYFDVVHSNELTLDNDVIDYRRALEEISRVLKPGGFYLANEHFDAVKHLKISGDGSKTQQLLRMVEDESFLAEIGFAPMIRIKYVEAPKSPHHFIYYLFEKRDEPSKSRSRS